MRIKNPMIGRLALASALVCALSCACQTPQSAAAAGWQTIFDGQSLDGWESIPYGGEGEVALGKGYVLLPRGAVLTGIRRPQGLPVKTNYEIEARVTRVSGNDFFCGLTFPAGDEYASVILGGWGGGLCGLSCIDGQDASQNETKSLHSFQDQREYWLILRVETHRIRAWINRKLLFDVDTHDRHISLRTEMLPSVPLGISAYITAAKVGPMRWRPISQG